MDQVESWGERDIFYSKQMLKFRFVLSSGNSIWKNCFFVYPGPKGSEEANYNMRDFNAKGGSG
jgi:hypothetical protein